MFSALAQLDIGGGVGCILTKFPKMHSDLGGDAITRKCLQADRQTERRTDRQTVAGEIPLRKASLDYAQKS